MILDAIGAIVGVAAWILFFYFPLLVLVSVLVEIYQEEKEYLGKRKRGEPVI